MTVEMTLVNTLLILQKLAAIAVAVQAVEYILLKNEYSDQGPWRWDILRKDFKGFPKPIQKIFDLTLSGQGFLYLSCLQLFACVLLFISMMPFLTALACVTLFIVSLLSSIRWRGAFNGGNDSMTLILIAALGLAHFANLHSIWPRACVLYIAVQVIVSLFISGLTKLQNNEWRSGLAFKKFLLLDQYAAPKFVQHFAVYSKLCRICAWVIIMFEVTFPLALISPTVARVYIAFALVFQFANFYLIGLNRFFFTWLAAYPALYFASFR